MRETIWLQKEHNDISVLDCADEIDEMPEEEV